MTGRLGRRFLGCMAALACLFALVGGEQRLPEPDLAPVADATQFNAGNIISDALFYDGGSMTAAAIQDFLELKGAACTAGEMPCLKDYRQNTATQPSDSLCKGYQGVTGERASAIIAKVGASCGINPRVLLVLLQKEQSLVTGTRNTTTRYTKATGFACPDTAPCNPEFQGFVSQVYFAARQFQRYRVETWPPYKAFRTNTIKWDVEDSCGTSQVYIENHATAALYNYTPYRPNKAALAAGYGYGDSCSAYGNRNFWLYYTDWFGSTQIGGRDPDAPVGRLETVRDQGDSVLVRGWVYDPNSPTSAVRLGIIADGVKIGSDTTDVARPDVAGATLGVGPNQGFETKLPLKAGKHTVCVYAANIGAGSTSPRLGCATLTITTAASWNPKGRVTDVRVAGTRVVVEGWSFDPDSPKSPNTVRIYSDGLRLGDVVADDDRPTVGTYYPYAGSAHGFRLDSRLTKGTHRVCAYALNKGIGTKNPSLGCRTVTVTADPITPVITTGSPVGRVATVEQDGQDVRIVGWSFDPDAATKPVTVQLFAGSTMVSQTIANGDWPDVARQFPYAGSAHKFTFRSILPHGTYTLCVRAVNVGAGADKALTCRSVTVVGDPAANPIGGPRQAEVTGSTVRIAGWSYDPDVPTAPVTVRVFRGTTKVGEMVADGEWPDVAKYHPAAGSAHGFEWTGTLPAGEHILCVEAVNLRYGTKNPRLGCKTVTVGAVAQGSTDAAVPPSDTGATRSEAPAGDASSTGATDAPGTGTGTGTGTTGTGTTGTESTSSEATSTGTTDDGADSTFGAGSTGAAGAP